MKRKLQLLPLAIALLLSVKVSADDVTRINNLDLNNPDVRKCLIEASKSEGWDLKSVYLNSEEKLVYIFSKGKNDKVYTSVQAFPSK
ncbi:hypothetical protein [Snuella sedimenti]|uniref:PepSY domain-containing protein n=1 Tax=Snuella sedimenti TaxID=2798802 RepID=A0A8J7JBT7_9FLAO|nr:hypothetical protein [Snuella sedimenti]MBJ6368224.1 hypothetical protein [Snuella sedimenti]